MGMGRERDGDGGAGHRKHLSVTTVNTASYRDSTDLERPTTAGTSLTTDTGGKGGKDGAEGLNEKWRKFKAKLRRTTSRRSLKSVRSVKSTAAVDKEGLNGNGDMASPKSTV